MRPGRALRTGRNRTGRLPEWTLRGGRQQPRADASAPAAGRRRGMFGGGISCSWSRCSSAASCGGRSATNLGPRLGSPRGRQGGLRGGRPVSSLNGKLRTGWTGKNAQPQWERKMNKKAVLRSPITVVSGFDLGFIPLLSSGWHILRREQR